MKRPLIFVGSRQMMGELACIAELNDIEILGILNHHYIGQEVAGIPVIGDERWLLDKENTQAQQWLRTCDFFPGDWHQGEQPHPDRINLANLRLERIRILEESEANVINLIHPDASVRGLSSRYGNYKIGKGIQIHANVYHGIDNIEIGDYCAFMSGNTTAHDVRLGSNVLVAPDTHLYKCNIGNNGFIGIYSRVNPFKGKGAMNLFKGTSNVINIGQNVTVWNGAEIVKDIPDSCFYTTDGRILSKKI